MTNAQPKQFETNNTIQFPGGQQTFTLSEAQIQAMIQAAVNEALTKQAAPKPERSTSMYTSKGVRKAQAAEPMYSADEFQRLGNHLLAAGDLLAKRNYMMWVLGCTLGCRGGDLCETRFRDVLNADGSVKKYHTIYEQKTGKYNRNIITELARDAIEQYVAALGGSGKYAMEDYLIKSRKGGKLNLNQVYRILNKAAAEIGLPQNIGTHTMRKTYGYMARQSGGDSVMDLLQAKYKHSDQRATMRYLTITQANVDGMANMVAATLSGAGAADSDSNNF